MLIFDSALRPDYLLYMCLFMNVLIFIFINEVRYLKIRNTTLHGLPVIIASSHVTDVEHVDPCKNKRADADYLSDRYGIVPQQVFVEFIENITNF